MEHRCPNCGSQRLLVVGSCEDIRGVTLAQELQCSDCQYKSIADGVQFGSKVVDGTMSNDHSDDIVMDSAAQERASVSATGEL